MIETTVDSIRVSLVTQNRVVLLRETNGDRHLPIWIGSYEAEAIMLRLQGVPSTRPIPYDLMATILDELGASVSRIAITHLADQVYFARITILAGDREIEIDSRPSDAIALAVRTDARILVDESVMDQAGVPIDSDDDDDSATMPTVDDLTRDQTIPTEESGGKPGATEEGLSVFRDFINSLDLDDFDRRRSS